MPHQFTWTFGPASLGRLDAPYSLDRSILLPTPKHKRDKVYVAACGKAWVQGWHETCLAVGSCDKLWRDQLSCPALRKEVGGALTSQ